MKPDRLTLKQTIEKLKKLYGAPSPPPTRDPFELVIFENVAYLAKPAKRLDAFLDLKQTVGLGAKQILAAKEADLLRVAGRGILKSTFATKLRECARIAVDDFAGNLNKAMAESVDTAKRALRKFPGIGEPGAEKILLFAGLHPYLAPESNGLRVVGRLGLVEESANYARMYNSSRPLASEFNDDLKSTLEAHLLLHQHGQTLCKRSKPNCSECPLRKNCKFAAESAANG